LGNEIKLFQGFVELGGGKKQYLESGKMDEGRKAGIRAKGGPAVWGGGG